MKTNDASNEIFTVTELNLLVKELLESNLPSIWLEAEISNLAQPSSGHFYFSLKDERCQVRCAMFRNRNRLLEFKPANGDLVLARVNIGFYEPRGEFQLIVERMEPAGEGILRRKFEQLKNQLLEEGLFDEVHKQDIPELPSKIGVITSTTGAAIRDVLSVLQRRFPAIPVLIYPVAVQGANAAPSITHALELAASTNECDVLLLVRGGGSLEDLWAFNEEKVARAIFASKIPVVTGIGHETDTTIADYVADLRGATPSAAAELVSPDQFSYLQTFDYYETRIEEIIRQKVQGLQQRLGWISKRLQQQHPLTRLNHLKQRQLELRSRLSYALKSMLKHHTRTFQLLHTRLASNIPSNMIQQNRQQIVDLKRRLLSSILTTHKMRRATLSELSRTLQVLSPLETLARGYSITSLTSSGKLLHTVNDCSVGDDIQVKLKRGQLLASIIQVTDK